MLRTLPSLQPLQIHLPGDTIPVLGAIHELYNIISKPDITVVDSKRGWSYTVR